MSKKSGVPDHLRSHAIVLPGGCVVAICITQGIAEVFAAKAYPSGQYIIRIATKRDLECVAE